jgi:hypothetical protein
MQTLKTDAQVKKWTNPRNLQNVFGINKESHQGLIIQD